MADVAHDATAPGPKPQLGQRRLGVSISEIVQGEDVVHLGPLWHTPTVRFGVHGR